MVYALRMNLINLLPVQRLNNGSHFLFSCPQRPEVVLSSGNPTNSLSRPFSTSAKSDSGLSDLPLGIPHTSVMSLL